MTIWQKLLSLFRRAPDACSCKDVGKLIAMQRYLHGASESHSGPIAVYLVGHSRGRDFSLVDAVRAVPVSLGDKFLVTSIDSQFSGATADVVVKLSPESHESRGPE